MEQNFIWDGDTHFYINFTNKTYGCKINRKEASKAKEIIKYFKIEKKEQIAAWKKNWKLTTEDFIEALLRYLNGKRDITRNTYNLMKIVYFKEVINNGNTSISNSENQEAEKVQA